MRHSLSSIHLLAASSVIRQWEGGSVPSFSKFQIFLTHYLQVLCCEHKVTTSWQVKPSHLLPLKNKPIHTFECFCLCLDACTDLDLELDLKLWKSHEPWNQIQCDRNSKSNHRWFFPSLVLIHTLTHCWYLASCLSSFSVLSSQPPPPRRLNTFGNCCHRPSILSLRAADFEESFQ